MDALGALGYFHFAYSVGHRPMAENAVTVMHREGMPCAGMMTVFDSTWEGVDTSEEAAIHRSREAMTNA